MDRCTLKATAPIVSEKVAKLLTARNAVCEKELSYVTKNLERKKNDCKASIEKAKDELLKSLTTSNGLSCAKEKTSTKSNDGNLKQERSFSLYDKPFSQPCTNHNLLCEKDKDNTPSPIPFGDMPLQKGPLTTDDNKTISNKSTATTKNTQTLAAHLGENGSSLCSDETSEIPEILVTSAEDANNNTVNHEKPQRKISLTRSYSTGDLPKADREATCVSQRRRVQSTSAENMKGSYLLDGKTIAGKTRHDSLDGLFFQSLSNMLQNEKNALTKLKPRSKPYSEEPFYLRKKCISQRGSQERLKDLEKTTQELFANKELTAEQRSLASILPPIALPSIYTSQQNSNMMTLRNKDTPKNGTRKTQPNPKLTVNASSLTQNLRDCRYLR